MSTAAEFKDIGNKHLQAKEFDLAIDAYTKAIELNPSDHVSIITLHIIPS
jgi:predicted TPR repeat methyltransferase